MAIDRLIAGAEDLIDDRVRYAEANRLSHRTGAEYRRPSSPWRFVGHTIEAPTTWALSTLRNAAITHRTPPHLWASPEHDWVGQTVPLTLSAYALKHDANDPETNHMHAIQLELLSYARDSPYTEYADWIGENVLGPVLDAGVPINISIHAQSDGADAYGENGTVRMSWDEWARFNGLCSHQNVPGNSHWDVGFADYPAIARAARNGATPTPTPIPVPQETDVMIILECNDNPRESPWIIGGGPPRRLTPAERTAYRSLDPIGAENKPLIPKADVSHAEMMIVLNSEARRHGIELR